MIKAKFDKPTNVTAENFELLKEALKQLDAKQRAVVRMRFWDCLSIQEISSRIGMSWESTDELIDSTVNHLRFRIIQLAHVREEQELMKLFMPLAA